MTATIAGQVFAACTTRTVDSLALKAGGVRVGREWQFPDGSTLRVVLGCVEYPAPAHVKQA